MSEHTFSTAFSTVKQLVEDFQANEQYYLSPKYQEAEVRKAFIDKFWIALGWDVNHEKQKNPYEQEVRVEPTVKTEEKGNKRTKKADYAFYAAPNFRDVKFFVEAKKPARNLDNADDYFQTIRYGFSGNTPLAVLTDFEQFRILYCRKKPTIETALNFALEDLKFDFRDYGDEEKFRKIYYLFSRESVLNGSLEKYAQELPKRWRGKQKLAPAMKESFDESFLDDLDDYREKFARAFKNKNPELNGEELTEAVTRAIDRLVFIRFLEDKLIEPDTVIDRLNSWADFVRVSARLNSFYNGIVFKPHYIDSPDFKADERTFAEIRGEFSPQISSYNFNYIPVHILGSIYERFLGKVIVASDKGAEVEEKPEVRKAGGVYYTPEYIVRYIVENTVGKLVENKTPEEISEMRFADIACGSGSFLLGVYDYLLRYHTEYYNAPRRKEIARKAGCIENEEGVFTLSIAQRREILRNNIYGVDVDAQATEVAQLSLALKLLEDATTATTRAFQPKLGEKLLPDMSKNIVCGNSLVDWDILDGQLFERREERKLNPMSYENKFPEVMRRGGFDAIVGNPPYIRIQTMQENVPMALDYFKRNYLAAAKGNYDIYVVFVEQALRKMNEQAKLGYILPHKFFNAKYGEPLRGLLAKGKNLSHIVHFGDQQIFDGATTYTALLFANKSATKEIDFVKVDNLMAWRENGTSIRGIIQASNVTASEWNFNAGSSSDLLEKLKLISTKLEDVTDRIFQGIKTSADKIYIVEEKERNGNRIKVLSREKQSEYWLERDLLHPLIKGGDSKRYSLTKTNRLILFPYAPQNNGLNGLIPAAVFKEKYPLTWKYLLDNKKYLENRENGKMSGTNWYAFGRSQALDVMPLPKIFTPDIAPHSAFSLDAVGEVFFTGGAAGGYGILVKSDISRNYILGLLNSRLLEWFIHQTATSMRGGWFSYESRFIRHLPIRTINFADANEKAAHDKMVALVEQMLEAKKNLQAARSDRDKQFYQDRCGALDRQIDKLVYDLYELTPEEIEIVEGKT